jgi:hypothetical protein
MKAITTILPLHYLKFVDSENITACGQQYTGAQVLGEPPVIEVTADRDYFESVMLLDELFDYTGDEAHTCAQCRSDFEKGEVNAT